MSPVEVHTVDDDPRESIAWAIQSSIEENRHADLEELIQRFPEAMTYFDRDLRWMPIHYAAKYGNADAARLLLESGSDPNANDSDRSGDTPLDLAVDYGHERAVRVLLDFGANPNIPTFMWVTAMNRAIDKYLQTNSDDRKRVFGTLIDMLLPKAREWSPPVYPDGSVPDSWPPTQERPYGDRVDPVTGKVVSPRST